MTWHRDTPRHSGWLLLLLLATYAGCSGSDSQPPSPSAPGPPALPPRPDQIAILVGAGDIGLCGSPAPLATGRLLDSQPGTIFAVGDLAYEQGTAQQFLNCYDPAWGRHKSRTRPVPGNHEYSSPDAAPYFAYFGSNAGPAGLGYYTYPAGDWQIYALNSNLEGRNHAVQMQWLRREMSAQPSKCSLAYFHHPRFSSGPHGLEPPIGSVRDMWIDLYAAGTDVVVSGHEHIYERFAPQTVDGLFDADYGMRQFVVGTGGASLSTTSRRAVNNEMLIARFGVLKLTLEPQSYRWEFLSADGGAVLDSGSDTCHGLP